MALSGDAEERKKAVEQLGHNFAVLPDTRWAWYELTQLTQDSDNFVRWRAIRVFSFCVASACIPDECKHQAWNLLLRLIKDNFDYVRRDAADSLGTVFLYAPDKNQAWANLLRFTKDENSYVRSCAANTLGTTVSYVAAMSHAWTDLLQLMQEKDDYVRWGAAVALGIAYSYVPDKDQTWLDLLRLTRDKDHVVRASAYHSLGKASIFRAACSEKEDDFKKEIEEAIRYFEKSLQQGIYFKPAEFCLPFYRFFYTLTFEKEKLRLKCKNTLKKQKAL